MNNCTFSGRLTRDPEQKTVKDHTLVKFGLAVPGRNKSTDFFDFEAWDKTAELIAQFFFKGDFLEVVAEAREDKWTTEEGNKRSRVVFRVNQMHFSNAPKGNKEKESKTEEQVAEQPLEEAVPF